LLHHQSHARTPLTASSVRNVRVVCQLGASALHQSKTASPVHLAHLDQLAITENPVRLDPRVNLDHLAHQPILAQNPTVRASPALLAQPDQTAPTDNLDQWDPADNLAQTVSQDLADLPVQPDHPEMLVSQETLAQTVSPDLPARTEKTCTTPLDPRDPMDLLDLEARTAILDQLANPANQDQWDQLAKQEIPDIQVKTVNLAHQAAPDCLERTPITVPALTVPPSSSRRPSMHKLFNDCSSNDLISNLDLNRKIPYCNISPVVVAVMLFHMLTLNVNIRKEDER